MPTPLIFPQPLPLLWQEPASSGAKRRLLEATEGNGRSGRADDGEPTAVVAAADVLSWAEGPGEAGGRE